MVFLRKILTPGNFKNLILLGLALGLAGSIFVLGAFAFISRDLPDPNTLSDRSVSQSTKIYDRTGEHLLYEIHGEENRTLVKLASYFCNDPDNTDLELDTNGIPLIAIQASIAAEDRGFCEHHGFSIKGFLRAIRNNLLGGSGGGSTLTQQLVKNAILSGEKKISRKVKELILSVEIERRYSKDEILQIYFNEIPYGSTNYGIESAAQRYFNKSVKDITLSEAAVLAALPQRPTTLLNNPELLLSRRDWILDSMAELGFVSEDEKTSAKAEEIKIENPVSNIDAPHFVFYIKQLLEDELKLDSRTVEEGGLKVTTTLDYDLQKIAEEEVNNGVETRGERYDFNNAALVAEDPKTSQILAMVGSKDYFDDDIDGQVNVALSLRQPGSSFKPIVYTAGFIQGYTPNTILWDVKTNFSTVTGDYSPNNYDLVEHGPITVRQALQGSLNIPAVKMVYLVGVENSLKFAESLGYTSFSDRSRFGLSIVLGGAEVKLLEHVGAFGVLANEGIKKNTTAILKVEDPDGNILYEWKDTEGKKVIEPNFTRITSNVLSDNAARTYVFGETNYLNLASRPAAAKTGTTNDYNDAWTIGYTPSLVAGVWAGNTDGSDMARGADGSIIAAPIWNAFMRRALEGQEVENFNSPEIPITGKAILDGQMPGTTVVLDKASGKLATSYTPISYRETKTFAEYHNILYYINKEEPAGEIPASPEDDPMFLAWETAVQTWLENQEAATGIQIEQGSVPTEEDDLHIPSNFPTVSIESPSKNDSFDTRTITIAANAAAPRGVRRVEFYIDGYYLDSDNQAPYEISANIPNTINRGYHTIKVVAYDDIDNTGSESIGIKITAEAVSSGFSIVDPINGQTIECIQETYTVALSLENSSSFNSVYVYAEEVNSAERVLINTISPISSLIITTPWTLPVSGTWVISATAVGSGETLETPGTMVYLVPPKGSGQETSGSSGGVLNPFE
ncbi:MAG: Penicillin-binding protein, 1A family [Candidatus Uhrbacteria bacterium GW2011_GWE2_45_35]|uniref:peptidoglycan glycosyltransferase n=2 Tax=Candidatus Uhriibacteriota TaxID=1752732 RepID=A0A0G1LRR3_9BACT|nr:MAG: Penicillin-binding protein, 1A family [Candidatus Uhrbacteria bacterium GW2011_GWF2_44_350]KKU09023.1 MAG: Penicillin-binding protein, 1A family [Candidatus Uhrbacteria bacterium GW2011_GWE2_45_35]